MNVPSTRRWVPLVGACGLAVAGLIVARVNSSGHDADVVLDEPGVYQEPGISTNAPLQGTRLGSAVLQMLDGTSVQTSALVSRGRPMVVNFWFTTCPPCRREMPVLQQAFEEYGNDINFVGINVMDSVSTIRDFTSELGVTYDMLRDQSGDFTTTNGVSAFPTTLFVDSTGRIVQQISGELTSALITRAIHDLLNTR